MTTVAPPDVPPGMPTAEADYLRRLALWAFRELDKKVAKDEATPQLLLSASDQKTPTTILKLSATAAGVLTATPIPLGGGKP